MLVLYLYTTAGCHLCEKARHEITPWLQKIGLELIEIDIAETDAMIDKYGTRIPVISLSKDINAKTLDWPFDQQSVGDFLAEEGVLASGESLSIKRRYLH